MTSEPVIGGGRAAPRRRAGGLPWAYLALLLCVVLGLGANVLRFAVTMPLLDEVGYGDTFILYDVRQYALTGRLYRGPDEAPHNPSLYSPMFYLLASIPYRLAQPANPFLPARLMALTFFALTVLVAMSVTRALTRHPRVVVWSGLLGFSVYVFGEWAPQIRADFIGLLFALLSVRILMGRWRGAPALAGLAAGLSFGFKLTFVSAAITGVLWLVWRRRYRHAAELAAGAALTAAGSYLVFVPFEPHLIENVTAIRSSLTEYRGWVRFGFAVASEPVFLLALSAVPLFLRRLGPKSGLLLLYAAVSLLVGLATMRHPGANFNYLFETLLVAVPLASVVPFRLYRLAGQAPVVQVLVAVLILAIQLPTILGSVKKSLTWDVRARNAEWHALHEILQDKRVFPAAGPLALLAPSPPITEPSLIYLLEKQGRYDTGPLAGRLRAREFDLVVTRLDNNVYRGLQSLSPAFRDAIRGAYTPHCALAGRLFHLPKDERDTARLKDGLQRLGCAPMRDVLDASMVSW